MRPEAADFPHPLKSQVFKRGNDVERLDSPHSTPVQQDRDIYTSVCSVSTPAVENQAGGIKQQY